MLKKSVFELISKLKYSKLLLIKGLFSNSPPPDKIPRIGNIKDKLNASNNIVDIDKSTIK